MKALFSAIIMNQMLVCYISCYMHQCGHLIMSSAPSFLLKVDGFAELVAIITRISFGSLIDYMPYKTFRSIYVISSFLLIFSTMVFSYSLAASNGLAYAISWFLNRTFVSVITATRDYLIYRLSYSMVLNIPILKSLKTLGNILTIVHTALFFTNVGVTSYLLTVSAVVNFLFTIVTARVMDKTISQEEFNSQTSVESNFTLKNLAFVSLLGLLTSIFTLSDQIVYIQSSSIPRSTFAKFIGQTVFGLIYSLIFKNTVATALTAPLFVGLAYICFLQGNETMSFIAAILWGISITVKNASYIIIPRYMTTGYHQFYQIAVFFSESIAVIISCFMFDSLLKWFSKSLLLKLYFLASMFAFLLLSLSVILKKNTIAENQKKCVKKDLNKDR